MRRLLLAASSVLLLAGGTAAAAGGDHPGWLPVDCGCYHALSVDAVDRDLVFLGTDDGVSRSTDGGFTWRQLSTPVHGEVRRVSFANADDGVAAGAFEGVLVTHDGGSTWKQYRPWPDRTTDVAAVAGGFFGLTPTGLYRSTDGGIVWKQVHGLFNGGEDPHMAWRSLTEGIVVRAPYAYTTGDGSAFSEQGLGVLALRDAAVTGPSTGFAVGYAEKYTPTPTVIKLDGSGHAQADLAGRGFAQEQEFGVATSGSAVYVVGANGVIARSGDGGGSWSYEKTPPSYERSTFYDVDAIDGEHAWIAVYGGRVLIRNAPSVHDVHTSPHRGLGVGLLGVGALGLVGAAAAGAAGRRPVAGGLAVVAVLSGVGGALAVKDTSSCPASGCRPIAIGDESTPSPTAAASRTSPPTPTSTPSPTPSSTPSPTPSASPSPSATASPSATPSPSPRPTQSPSPSPRPSPTGAFTAALTQPPTCDPNGGAHPGTIRLRNSTSGPVAWTATPREKDQQQAPWATLSPAQGSVASGTSATFTVTPANGLCQPGNSPTTDHVDVHYGGKTIAVAVTVTPQT